MVFLGDEINFCADNVNFFIQSNHTIGEQVFTKPQIKFFFFLLFYVSF